MSKPLKVGDRVICYGQAECGSLDPTSRGYTGVVVALVQGDPYMIVGLDHTSGVTYYFHVKQCRRLIKKQPAREWFVVVSPSGEIVRGDLINNAASTFYPNKIVHVREVRTKRRG